MKWKATKKTNDAAADDDDDDGACCDSTMPAAVRSKWAAMAASIWMQSVSGSSYNFGFYSQLLKSTQLYDQQTLDTVALFKDIGANAGVISGAIYSSSPDASRPRLVLALGAVLSFAGYFFMWLSVAGILNRPPVPLMCLFMLLAAHSLTFFNTADVVTAARNFPDHRGTAIGIMKVATSSMAVASYSCWRRRCLRGNPREKGETESEQERGQRRKIEMKKRGTRAEIYANL